MSYFLFVDDLRDAVYGTLPLKGSVIENTVTGSVIQETIKGSISEETLSGSLKMIKLHGEINEETLR